MALSDDTLDLSLLPRPKALEDISFEALLAQRLADFKARAEQAGIDYDVDGLETDPIVVDQQSHAYREMLMRARVNDGIRSVLPAFSKGSDLDHVVARAGVVRIVTLDADGKETFREKDEALLRRYLASFAAPAAGSEDGYMAAALAAWPAAHDIRLYNGGPGKVLVYLLGADGQVAPMDAVFAVAKALNVKSVKGFTDDVTVSAALVEPYTFQAKLIVPRGPDPSLVVAAAVESVRAFGLSRYRIGAEVPAEALVSAAYVPNVRRILHDVAGDIPARQSVAPYLARIDLSFEVAA
jgi:phage-related baseplate assembly protein